MKQKREMRDICEIRNIARNDEKFETETELKLVRCSSLLSFFSLEFVVFFN